MPFIIFDGRYLSLHQTRHHFLPIPKQISHKDFWNFSSVFREAATREAPLNVWPMGLLYSPILCTNHQFINIFSQRWVGPLGLSVLDVSSINLTFITPVQREIFIYWGKGKRCFVVSLRNIFKIILWGKKNLIFLTTFYIFHENSTKIVYYQMLCGYSLTEFIN